MEILVFPDGETLSPLVGCSIHRLPDGLEIDDIEALLADGKSELVVRFDASSPRGSRDRSLPAPTIAPEPLFCFERDRAAADLVDPDGDLWPVNAYSDADELNGLVQAALEAGVIAREDSHACLYIYPLALSEPDPVLAVDPGSGPTLLGYSLKLREREGESPVDFTLRLLEDMVAEANALAASYHADGARLDRIASYMNRPGPWNGGDVCEVVAIELRESGRELLDNADEH